MDAFKDVNQGRLPYSRKPSSSPSSRLIWPTTLWAMLLVLAMGFGPAGAANDPLPVTVGLAPQASATSSPSDKAPTAPPNSADAGDWFKAWQKMKKDLEQTTGTSFSLNLDEHMQCVLNGPGEGNERDLFWWNLTVTQKLWKDAKLIVRVRGSSHAHGQHNPAPPHGISPLVNPKLNLDWMWSETTCIYVANLYVEQKLLDNKLMIAVGKINESVYFDTNDLGSWDFLSHSIAKNQAFPHKYHTIGAVVRYDPTDWLYFQAGAIDAQGIRSEMGTNTAFTGPAWFQSMYEVGLKSNFAGKKGNYRFELWHDPSHLTRWDGHGTENSTVGFGISFDQMITDKLGAFLKYGLTDGDVRTFGNTWCVGAIYKGLLPGRPKDVLALGFCQGIPDDPYRVSKHSKAQESLFETYYKIQVTDWCTIYPDVQVLLNPGMNPVNDVGVFAGIRVKLDF